ncbi:MAG: rRNA maturation RNase YbeY [Bacteroidia bacterium]|jgi:rRNA maturation RNase YbeY|nr:rRNA maturation RNase YbeY [Bacteroidia bacterium]
MPSSANQIQFFSDGIPFVLPAKTEARKWLARIARKHKKQIGQLTYIFVSDEQLWAMNKDYLQHHTYTDIITFDYTQGNTVSGELYLSIDRIRDNAKTYGVPLRDELHRVMAHGLLHLCGFKDKTTKDAALMRRQEDAALALRA